MAGWGGFDFDLTSVTKLGETISAKAQEVAQALNALDGPQQDDALVGPDGSLMSTSAAAAPQRRVRERAPRARRSSCCCVDAPRCIRRRVRLRLICVRSHPP